MIKCTEGGCEGHDMCCCDCPDRKGCEGLCPMSEESVIVGKCRYAESNDLTPFEAHSMTIMANIVRIENMKKDLDEEESVMREQLQSAMETYGVKSFDNDNIKVTYVEPTTRESIDSAKLKKELPEVAKKYTKVSQVKASVRITVK